ncbi:MAG: peroxidase [Acidobacteria bacterium]|nr:peroxidase [Acidobacteriota bacterium]
MERIKRDWRAAGLGEADRALLAFADKLTREPSASTESDLAELRRHGFGDEELLDAVQIISYFNYINRIADGLGVDLEDFMAPRPAAQAGIGAGRAEAQR